MDRFYLVIFAALFLGGLMVFAWWDDKRKAAEARRRGFEVERKEKR